MATARDTGTTYFVGSALPDTVLAGPASVKISGDGGHWGRGQKREVYGQLVRVDSIAGAHSELIRRAFGNQEKSEVIIVPWDYDAACQPTWWNRSARWVKPGLTGFYTVRLRPDSQWVGGRPTLDAFKADLEPYPHGPYFEAGYGDSKQLRTRESLDAAEMFTLFSALPTRHEKQLNDSSARLRLERWEALHPELARKYPADQILTWIRRGSSNR